MENGKCTISNGKWLWFAALPDPQLLSFAGAAVSELHVLVKG
jgi:hypothetical protein